PSFVCVRSIDFNSFFFFYSSVHLRFLHSFPTRRSSDLVGRCSQGLFAFSDSCTHKGGPLSDGALVGCTVQCPWHGSQFDVSSGRVVSGPAERKIVTYDTETRNGEIFIKKPERGGQKKAA